MSFYVGQKIKCIRDDWGQASLPPNLPKRGKVYTVRGVSEVGFKIIGKEYIWLFEITNPPVTWAKITEETAFRSTFFAPVDERKTDISVFTEILKTTKAPAPENV